MKRIHLPRYHPLDIFRFALGRIDAGQRMVLIILTDISGASARAVGTPMVVCENGDYAGYVSNGCVDADIALHAMASLRDGVAKTVRYGEGSPYLDIRLPCGGGITAAVLPSPNVKALELCAKTLEMRQGANLSLAGLSSAQRYAPPLHIIAAGRGENLLFLTHTARAAGISVQAFSPDQSDIAAIRACGGLAEALGNTQDILAAMDQWTAFVTVFHDHDYEGPLLQAALQSNAFYIGAMGSRKTHSARRTALADMGVSADLLSRLRGPIGLVPSMRDAGRLAVSVLADIIDAERDVF